MRRVEGVVDLPDGARLAFEDVGEGPVVTLLHPGLWDMRTWDPQVEPLVAAGYRVLRYDLRGYGRSSRLHGETFSHVRDAAALLDARDVGTTALVGCSMGGAIAIDTALGYPDRVWALVPVASGLGGVELLEEEQDWWDDVSAPIEEAVEAGEFERAQDLRLSQLWAPLGTDDEAGSRIRAIAFDNIHELTMDESGEQELEPPAAHRLGEVDVPTLVVVAGHDPADMRRIADLITRGIREARRVTIEDADHVVSLRTPERLTELLIGFLDDARPEG